MKIQEHNIKYTEITGGKQVKQTVHIFIHRTALETENPIEGIQ